MLLQDGSGEGSVLCPVEYFSPIFYVNTVGGKECSVLSLPIFALKALQRITQES